VRWGLFFESAKGTLEAVSRCGGLAIMPRLHWLDDNQEGRLILDRDSGEEFETIESMVSSLNGRMSAAELKSLLDAAPPMVRLHAKHEVADWGAVHHTVTWCPGEKEAEYQEFIEGPGEAISGSLALVEGGAIEAVLKDLMIAQAWEALEAAQEENSRLTWADVRFSIGQKPFSPEQPT
jgi:hypothetical protein